MIKFLASVLLLVLTIQAGQAYTPAKNPPIPIHGVATPFVIRGPFSARANAAYGTFWVAYKKSNHPGGAGTLGQNLQPGYGSWSNRAMTASDPSGEVYFTIWFSDAQPIVDMYHSLNNGTSSTVAVFMAYVNESGHLQATSAPTFHQVPPPRPVLTPSHTFRDPNQPTTIR